MTPPNAVAWLRAHPTSNDSIVAVLLLGAALAGMWIGNTGTVRHPDAWGVLLTVTIVAPVALRRRWSGWVLVTCGIANLIYDIANYPRGLAFPAQMLAVYSNACHRARRSELWPAAVWLAASLAHAPLTTGSRHKAGSIAGFVALSAVAWLLGDAVRSRRRENRALRARAHQAEHEREARALQAVHEERIGIARELHDVVAHALGVILMQAAGAGRKSDLDVPRARAALGVIESTGRQAFGEMRRLVGVLRAEDNDPDLTPQPTLDDIPILIRQLAAAGLDISLQITGQPDHLPAGAALSAYRIVQEALTNTLKHAGPTSAHVTLTWTTAGLNIDVTDDGRVAGHDRHTIATGGEGHGLIGMRERVQLFGGQLHTGPCAGGGFRVHATLPGGPPS